MIFAHLALELPKFVDCLALGLVMFLDCLALALVILPDLLDYPELNLSQYCRNSADFEVPHRRLQEDRDNRLHLQKNAEILWAKIKINKLADFKFGQIK